MHRIAYLNGSHCFVDPTMEKVDMLQLHDKVSLKMSDNLPYLTGLASPSSRASETCTAQTPMLLSTWSNYGTT